MFSHSGVSEKTVGLEKQLNNAKKELELLTQKERESRVSLNLETVNTPVYVKVPCALKGGAFTFNLCCSRLQEFWNVYGQTSGLGTFTDDHSEAHVLQHTQNESK